MWLFAVLLFFFVVSALIEVVNNGGGSEDAVVDIVVKDIFGVSIATNAVAVTQSVDSLTPVLFTIPFTVGSDWVPANYEVIATASKVAAVVPDSKDTEYLNVLAVSKTAVPELDLIFITLLAFSVLAVLFFTGKKN